MAAAQRKATWSQQVGLVSKDPQNEEDEELWLFEVGTGPQSSSGWRSASLQEVSGNHALPVKDRSLLLSPPPAGSSALPSATEDDELATSTVAPLPAGRSRASAPATATQQAKPKAKGKAKAKAAPPLVERLAKLRDQIDKEVEDVRSMVKDVGENPMAAEVAQWMQEYATEMATLRATPTHQNDEAGASGAPRHFVHRGW